jgi:protein-S-isoprenylcysteine O-methyltransferase Ste14
MPAGSPERSPLARAFAWAGGAAFVVSLASTAYLYLVILGREWPPSANGGVVRALVINAVLFGAFAMHHSLAARTPVKRWITRYIRPSLERSAYVWVSSILLMLVCALWRPVPGPALYSAGLPWSWLCGAIQVAGLWLIARTVAVLDARELAGIRQVDEPTKTTGVQVKGPYRWIRHPLYLGWILIVFLTPHMTPGRLGFAAITSTYLVVAIAWEERSLRQALGQPYEEYMRQVRWKIVPFVY